MTQPNLITLTDPRSPAAEAYRTLRTNLLFSSVDDPVRAVIVTSPAPEEGKSTALANLAVTMAQSGRRTIIVDADLRRPTQHEIWGVASEPGLTTMMLEDLDELPLVDVGVENLRLLPSGPLPPTPADLVGSARMDAVIARLQEEADFLLFDAPPVIAVSDAAILGSKLDGVLLVVRAGSTRRDDAEQAKQILERLGVRIVGAVLTNAELDQRRGRYYG
ncbi:MAG TPA: CpsD/CapB family tyrosine-protein kinase [Aggregatilineales bacterium]|nr:CpsD/CapB family tyrosine-protein kinase [Chloroflexota bacterium]HOA25425.1 CpsD/CapB family tyrosine-protein kinase [Aggregatilineales bacterium]HPV06815.1 CpsD/CapB family tyrosine-protein kinase [Aggregatilineales bacterium]HQA68625.1 CpsD/CapB family tyrosine-protein kinase [Aggregatilineales bacterium]HQE19188.1 CpsD/CapB family tyrosine-protein kinase [Aggregatilineales bacterium]